MGVASGYGYQRKVWIVGGIYGCGHQEADVVRMYRCGVVRR